MSDATNRSWVLSAEASDFPLQSLPYGVFSAADGPRRVGVAIGDLVLDLASVSAAGLLEDACPGSVAVFGSTSLNAFLARGRPTWQAVRRRLGELLTAGHREAADARPALEHALFEQRAVSMHLPVAVADYVDFYSSLHHATNVGKMFRPDGDPLLPNWRHLPVGYHGRSGTIVVSGTPVVRPAGQRRRPDGEVVAGPSERLDIELEVGFVVGTGSTMGVPVPATATAEHVFGCVLLNDWSARDIQAWEYQPLGPFLGKSFATSISAWILPLDALASARVAPPPQDPTPLPYLRTTEPWALDLTLEVWLRPKGSEKEERVTRTGFAGMYWTIAQQLAHLTVNGASLRVGDLFASGTVSGPAREERGSLLELTWNGTEPLELGGGTSRTFLEDGDEVILRGFTETGGVKLALGEVRGVILPAVPIV